MRTTTCKSCGKPILWVRSEDGNFMPLDTPPERRVILRLLERPNGETHEFAEVTETYTPHFATCPDADRWRKRRKLDV